MLYCLLKLCTVISTLRWAVLTVLWIGFCHTGPILLCIDSYVFICVYFACFCFILHSCCIIVSMVGWTWWVWSLILRTYLPSVLWHCWLGHMTCKNHPRYDLYAFGGTLNLTLYICLCCHCSGWPEGFTSVVCHWWSSAVFKLCMSYIHHCDCKQWCVSVWECSQFIAYTRHHIHWCLLQSQSVLTHCLLACQHALSYCGWLRGTVGGTPVFGRRTDTVLHSTFS